MCPQPSSVDPRAFRPRAGFARAIATAAIAFGAASCGASSPTAALPPSSSSARSTIAPPPADPTPNGHAYDSIAIPVVDGSVPRVVGPTRARTTSAHDIDFAGLPIATSVALSADLEGSSFDLSFKDTTSRSCPPPSVARPKVTWAMTQFPGATTLVRIGGVTLPPIARLDGGYEDVDLRLGKIASGPKIPATWINLAARTAATVDVSGFEGSFAPPKMKGAADVAWSARAVAIVPGAIYALRRCVERCADEADPGRVEEIVLVGPPPRWIGTSDDAARVELATDQPFSIFSARLARGSSATLTLVVEKGMVEDFAAKVGASPERDVTAGIAMYTLDVVWPAGRAPEATLFAGVFEGDSHDLDYRAETPRGPAPDCYAAGR